ncbi:MAG: hypothetical protein IT305_07785 [Chloroflexi bacterium]|nr:hypothetical protein [Chloroflexota bacterium]
MRRPHIPAFLVGMLLGLALLSLAGHLTMHENLFPGFVRFHRYINGESLFYPTASEIIAVARDAATDRQILVIVGGSSILHGAGQGAAELWTADLQQRLGDRYGVVNLAFPGGAPGEHGSVAAQALIQEGRSVVFATQVFPAGGEHDGGAYRAVVWDAAARGMLLPSADRDALLSMPGPLLEQRTELRVRAQLDRALAFTDLWVTITQEVVSTVWVPLADPLVPWWSPRRLTTDPAPGILPVNPNYVIENDVGYMRETLAEAASWCEERDGHWRQRIDPQAEQRFLERIAAQIPPGLRERSVTMVTASSPQWSSRLPSELQRCRLEYLGKVVDQLNGAGYHAVLVGEDWTAEDFVDRIHPNASGGRKMAQEIAPLVREIAGR